MTEVQVSRIVVFGAGGRAGVKVVAEAAGRGHEVTAVVREPGRHRELGGPRVKVVAGDVTDAGSVAGAAAGHDVALQVAARLDVAAEEFYGAATRALVDGLGRAGVSRLVALGIGSLLEVSPGVRLIDTPGFPADARAFSLGHAAELALLEASALDWVVIAPPPVFLDAEAGRTGRYRFGDGRVPEVREGDPAFSYADLAVALVDEAQAPRHHRVQVAVSY
ncbi:NAD(P)-dependent oxidoreductase [Nonomuraea gerenzanensis]|uniref:NAD-binding protein, putative n=1 Tax=Nonomuraea gerenzanensis TaxID=93944 RepID=A0A1M4EH51_9ACTN|nr:NAD(P)H-binding protein [Nonomuraea gerenzanensis]UBU09653.1 NAD(P)H-binding protein [Nonomuraea gerenzanensis]SBO98084.1 NAD-binding protein, putative [Nonomuraea gerenzanensis]